ncbi:hypothetical protein ACN47E_005641 [Coniothyrium glycines]
MKTFILTGVIAISQAAAMAVPEPKDVSLDHALEARIVGNEASFLLCNTPGSGKCGIFATYTNGQSRQSVSYQTGGTTKCSYEFLQKHTNGAGFWVDLNIFGSSRGANIGYNPTGKSISLGTATSSSNGQTYLNGRCQNEFGWGNIDTSNSGESFWGNLATKLY